MATADKYIDAAAADYGRHTRGGGGWALGLAVAASVKPGTGQGARQPRGGSSKVSAGEFARRAGNPNGGARVMAHLVAWDKAAEKGLVPYAEDLVPEDWDNAENIPKDADWIAVYDSMAQATLTSDRERLEKAAKEAGVSRTKVIDVVKNRRAVVVAISADPTLAAAVAADTGASSAVRRERNKQTDEWADDLRNKRNRLRSERLERDMEEGIDPDDNVVTRMGGVVSDLDFTFKLAGIADDLEEIVKRFQRDGFTPTHRDSVRLHAPKIREALDNLEVLVETGDVDDEAEQLLGGN